MSETGTLTATLMLAAVSPGALGFPLGLLRR